MRLLFRQRSGASASRYLPTCDKSHQCLSVASGQGPSRRSHSSVLRVGHCWRLCCKSLVTEPQPEGVVPFSCLRWLLFFGFFLHPYATARRSYRHFGSMGAFKHYRLLGDRDCDLQGNTFPHTDNRSNLRRYLRPGSHNLRALNLEGCCAQSLASSQIRRAAPSQKAHDGPVPTLAACAARR
jgi:hypothetical protein